MREGGKERYQKLLQSFCLEFLGKIIMQLSNMGEDWWDRWVGAGVGCGDQELGFQHMRMRLRYILRVWQAVGRMHLVGWNDHHCLLSSFLATHLATL